MSLKRGPFGVRWTASGGASAGFTPASGFALSGTVSDGQTLTLTKAAGGFGTKPNGAKPLCWWPLEDSVLPDAALSRLTTNDYTPSGELSSAIVSPGSAGSFRYLFSNASEANAFTGLNRSASPPDRWYVWKRSYYDFDYLWGTSFNLKQNRFYNSGLFSTRPNTYLQGYQFSDGYPAYDGGGYPRMNVELPSGVDPVDGVTYIYAGFPFVGKAWHVWELEFDPGTEDTQDAIIHYLRNGVQWYDPAHRWKCRYSSGGGQYCYWFPDQNSNGIGSLVNPYLYYDAIYVDDSFCRVMVSDEPSWQSAVYPDGTARNREIQIPTAWADGSISFVLRQGAHANLSGKYLYVVTSDGAAIKAGSFS